MWPFTKPTVRVIRREVHQITMQQWRTTPDLLNRASRVLADDNLHAMLAVLRTNALDLCRDCNPAESPDFRVAHADRAAGYAQALADLEALAVPLKPDNYLESEFLDPDADQPQTAATE